MVTFRRTGILQSGVGHGELLRVKPHLSKQQFLDDLTKVC